MEGGSKNNGARELVLIFSGAVGDGNDRVMAMEGYF